MDIKQFSFLCLSAIALTALSAATSGAQPGSEIDLRQLHQVRSALRQAHSANQPLALQNTSLSATANAAAPSLTPLTNQLPDGITFTPTIIFRASLPQRAAAAAARGRCNDECQGPSRR